jgi:hypothetical protein
VDHEVEQLLDLGLEFVAFGGLVHGSCSRINKSGPRAGKIGGYPTGRIPVSGMSRKNSRAGM